LGLKWDAVSFDDNTIAIQHTVVKVGDTVYKNNRTKNDSSNATFPMVDMIAAKLRKWRERQAYYKSLQPNDYIDEGYVCTYEDGRLFAPEYISQHFALLLRKNDMPRIRFHDLRHSSASYLKYLGFDLKDIQTWLRHKDIQTTMNIYTHLDMEAKSNIAHSLEAKLRTFGSQHR